MIASVKKCFLLVVIILGISGLQSQPKNIAILKFNSANISSDEVGILTDRLSTELVNLGAFTVIERSQMEEVLKEQGFQQSGCTTNECAVEVGRLVGVQQMVTGSIGKIGSIYTISARLIDVETGELLSQYSLDCACPIETILTESMAEIAQKLATGRKITLPVVETPKFGSVEFTSNEEGVEVFQNNISLGITPIVLENQDIGEYPYSARNVGFRDKSGSYEIKPGERATVVINISRTEGTLSIEGGRPGQKFDLTVDDQSFSNISNKTLNLPVDTYDLTIKEYGYYDLNKSVVIEDRKTSKVIALTNPILVSVKFNLSPSTAAFTLNSKSITATENQSLKFGDHRITAKAKGYLKQSKAFKIENSNPLTIDLHLEAKSRTRSRLLSTILPGSGQIYAGKSKMGLLYLGLTIGSAYALSTAYSNHNAEKTLMDDLYDDYSSAVMVDDIRSKRSLYMDQVDIVNDQQNQIVTFGIVLGTAWAINIIDIYLFNGLPNE